MTYQEVLHWMFTQLPVYQREGKSAYKANLDNTYALMKVLNHPYRTFKSVHIAGTNGKGSCAHMLASIYQEQGYTTGLYTSPHLKDYRERIKINGELIPADFVIDFIQKYRVHFKKIKASFFEMTVGLAFAYFADQKVDIAIVETGLGGRLDSTNIITPILSVITNIGMDHTQFLGASMPAIATEKAGIIKQNIPVIIGEHQQATDDVFIGVAEQKEAPITFAQDIVGIQKNGQRYIALVKGLEQSLSFNLPLLGNYQQQNICTVIAAALTMQISPVFIEKGLEKVLDNTKLQGRWQILKKQPLCIADTAHNKEGLTYVMKQLQALEYEQLHIVLAVVNDKSLEAVLPLFPTDAIYYFSQADIPRALPVRDLVVSAKQFNMRGKAFSSVKLAYNEAVTNAGNKDLVFVGGSTFTVAEVV